MADTYQVVNRYECLTELVQFSVADAEGEAEPGLSGASLLFRGGPHGGEEILAGG